MKYILLAITTVFLIACTKEAESTQEVGFGYKVEKLFTVDGCTVYRFSDGGYKYFTNCKGNVEWIENCGKACNREISIGG